MSGTVLIILFVVIVALMVVAISKWKVHPFLAILGAALLLAIVAGLPLDSIPGVIGKGFSSIFTSIGLVIIFGILIGAILEKTGAAVKLADFVLRIVGRKHPQLAIMLIGWIVSIPVFCDSGFVILNPVRKSLARKSGASSVALTVALSAGLYASHVFIPPTPGPIAAAGMMGLDDHLLLVIGIGILVSVPALVAAYFFAKYIGKRVKSSDEAGAAEAAAEYDAALASFGKLPSAFASAVPILLPVLLMALGSIAGVLNISGVAGSICVFLGKPVIALAAGFISALPLLKTAGNSQRLNDLTKESLMTAGPIIFITAAGGVLGTVMVEAGFVQFVQDNASIFSSVGILFPFLTAAILKSALGSSTVAITTTAGMMGMFSSSTSMLAALGMTTPLSATLAVMAIGAGAMTVSHANDSYFWVVTNFGGLTPQDGYRTQTMMTLVMGLASALALLVASILI